MRNRPTGTAQFWIDAIRFRLKEQFAEIDTSTVGGCHFIRFKPYPGVNYIYSIALTVKRKKINIIQLFFPGEEQEKRYLEPVQSAIKSEYAL